MTRVVVAVAALVTSSFVLTSCDEPDQAAPAPVRTSSPTPTVEPDTRPPRIEITAPTDEVPAIAPVVIAGTVDEEAVVTVHGMPAKVKNGRFRLRLTQPPHTKVVIEATDEAGNSSNTKLTIETVGEPIRGVHVSAYGWSSSTLRAPLMSMIKAGKINTIELDLKDESGLIGYDSRLPEAKRIGSVLGVYDLAGTVARLNRMGVRVVGRLVAFRDPVLAKWAWNHGERAQVIQTPKGRPYAGYGGFTNPANAKVRRYNIDIAIEAAKAGVDDILYDYVRRPDGPIDSMRFPGIKGSPERSIAGFVKETQTALEPFGARLGLSVFGIAATRPKEIGQNVRLMAKHSDYIAPMLYPSHWAPGEYNVGNPNANPYPIVKRSLKDFKRLVRGTKVAIVPWLQDFSLGVHYGVKEVRAQIDAARDAGIDQFFLWDPRVTYTSGALDRKK